MKFVLILSAFVVVTLSSCYRHSVCATYVQHADEELEQTIVENN